MVVDLGANMGNFTCMALAAHPDTRVIAIEPSRSLNDAFIASVGLNPGFLERVRLVRAFVGGLGAKQQTALQKQSEDYGDAVHLTEQKLLQLAGGRIDFLKCDIEGSEFDLIKPHSRILHATRKFACEVHAFGGAVQEFIDGVTKSGFKVLHVKRDPDGTATLLAKRR
jgi:FkbM family methyltransferase